MNRTSETGFEFFSHTEKNHTGVPVYDPAIPAEGTSVWTKVIAKPARSLARTASIGTWNRPAPPHRHRRTGAVAGIAFEAWGATREELFLACAEAVTSLLVNNPEDIKPRERSMLSLAGGAYDILLFSLLHELIVMKETQGLVMKIHALSITADGNTVRLKAAAAGETIDRSRNGLITHVKAMTLHRLSVARHDGRWTASVAFDVLSV